MFLRLFGMDRGRRAEYAALACCAVFAALGVWLLLRLLWALLPGSADQSLRAVERGNESVAAAPAPSIADMHLFGTAPARASAGGTGLSGSLALILRGTLAGRDPHSGIAVIADAGKGERAFRVGDEVSADVRLSAVYPDHAVLTRAGVEEILKLPQDTYVAASERLPLTPGRSSSRTSSSPPVTVPAAAGARAAPAGQAPSAWQHTVEQLRQNPQDLMRRVQTTPVFDGGKLSGVRLSASADDAALMQQVGLQPDDVVTQVNDVPIDSIARGQQILAGLGNATSVRVTVLRNGKPVQLTLGQP